jgi:HSP20 family protein
MLSTTRFSPLAVLSDMQRMGEELDRALHLANGSPRSFAVGFPPVNMWETDLAIHVEVELPGFQLKDIDLTVENSTLKIQGERAIPDVGDGDWRRRERGYGKFSRAFTLPQIADTAQVNATFANGVLQLEIAKREEAKPRKIEVQSK